MKSLAPPLFHEARGEEESGSIRIDSKLGQTLIRQIAPTVLQYPVSLSPCSPVCTLSFPVDSSRNRRKWVSRPPFLLQTRRGLSPVGDSPISH